MKFAKKIGFVFATVFLQAAIFAQSGAPKNLYCETLENGLQVFALESRAVPLAYIEIAIRGGGIGQTNETAGLFHLYEHMMFKGNEKHPAAAKVQRALSDLGCASWNGSTGAEAVNYYFTVPSDLARDGMEFWRDAICNPLLDEAEFEREKAVVVSEIVGRQEEPDLVLRSEQIRALFPSAPWRLDPAGSPKAVQNATIENLREIKEKFYIPNNAALFVGGDVQHEEIFKFARELFGGWQKSESPQNSPLKPFSREPFEKSVFCAMENPQIPSSLARVQFSLRGPDAEFDIEDTYAADVLTHLLQNPDGVFKSRLLKNPSLKIPGEEYVSAGYYTQRQAGEIAFSAVLLGEDNLSARVFEAKKEIFDGIFEEIAKNPNFFSAEDLRRAAQRIDDENLYSQATCKGFLSALRFWWATCGADYYFSYSEKIKKVDGKAISAFAQKYLAGKSAFVSVEVSGEVFSRQKERLFAAGFSPVSAESAFWWKNGGFAPTTRAAKRMKDIF